MIRRTVSALRVRPLSLGLLGVAGLSVLAAGFWPLDATAPVAATGAPPFDLARLAAADLGPALARPLFDPERRSWTARGSREDLTAEAPPPTLLSVRGILIEDRARRALVADGTTEPVWLSPGEGRGAWRLVSIEPGQVVVADANRRYTLAFLAPPVALRPLPRHPVQDASRPDDSVLRSTLEPQEPASPIRRVPILPPGRP